jgi:hypothetical protein
VRYNVFPLPGVGVALIVFFDPIRLEDDALSRPDKVIRQLQRRQCVLNERFNSLKITVIQRARKGGHTRQIFA